MYMKIEPKERLGMRVDSVVLESVTLVYDREADRLFGIAWYCTGISEGYFRVFAFDTYTEIYTTEEKKG